mmetsp:Transcript_10197/g.9208  ORF Transcript_10197/g.9208 Transcript_10197/m.9208 type:complete len:137 (-) Transcript_10197:289-699(-)|eukprot:CAMPEP_0201572262 /NCGR_PEP_ID=MMETSP0190_2-20130828/15418_1 /ASSEMBLY_ACC=CAM_ASM_000263 /TAXON_ID=37353 /ORGANISM="Rosalina sp." /LENGTH=136 /DNA_ID=CAMNT_0047997789 /DNA_START=128 /DNA_END=538 /DNA_ORIENTATION=-
MSTKNSGGNSSGELPDRQGSSMKSGNLHIQMLERGGDEMTSDMNSCLNLCLCAIALLILYGFYVFFGWAWLTAMQELGEDLNWAFFGSMIAVGGGMAGGVAYSMKSQQIGFWEPLSPTDKRRDRDPRGKCCGFQIY